MSGKTLFCLIAGFLFSATVFGQAKQNNPNTSNRDIKFLEDISIDVNDASTAEMPRQVLRTEVSYAAKKETSFADKSVLTLEKANRLQFKYALLLDVEVEMIKNLGLFRVIEEWYGVKYRLGGLSKAGIDCSALMQVFFTALYGISLPRTAREQYNFTRRISRTELKEGDLVFFNTTGGISHVGMYLANNKFVHASTGGVTISSLYDDYYARRFVGVGRIDDIHSSPSF